MSCIESISKSCFISCGIIWVSCTTVTFSIRKKITFYHWLVLYFLRFICTIIPLQVFTFIQFQVSQYASFKPPHTLWWQSLHFDEDAWVGFCYVISSFLLCDRTTGSGSSCRNLTVSIIFEYWAMLYLLPVSFMCWMLVFLLWENPCLPLLMLY